MSSPDPGASSIDIERLKQLLEERRLSPETAARNAGLGASAIKDIIYGRSKSPRMNTITAIAYALGVPPADFLIQAPNGMVNYLELKMGDRARHPESKSTPREQPRGVRLTPVVGVVEAGAWRVTDLFEAEEFNEEIPIPDLNQFGAKQAAFKVAGDSMDLADLPAGSYAVTVDWVDGGFEMEDGMVVVVERVDGHRREWTVKELRLFADRFELWPRSSNSRHRPIIVRRDSVDEDGLEVRILGLVVGTWRPLKRSVQVRRS